MSKEAVAEFLIKLEEDPGLQEALRAVVSDRGKQPSLYGQEAVEFAGTHGYEFTLEELQDHFLALTPDVPERELSDAELEGVAGGTWGIYSLGSGFSISPVANCYLMPQGFAPCRCPS